ncbi:MAG TPA: hypothetical protein VFA60_01130 [Terriglobales bacterium]|nr:hypothetical protein [Terriglobales bacterium]
MLLLKICGAIPTSLFFRFSGRYAHFPDTLQELPRVGHCCAFRAEELISQRATLPVIRKNKLETTLKRERSEVCITSQAVPQEGTQPDVARSELGHAASYHSRCVVVSSSQTAGNSRRASA